MKVVALHCQKGGAGKSLCAVHLAVSFALRGKTVVILGLDSQGTVESWSADRSPDAAIVTVESARIQELPRMLERAREQGVDLALLDTPGRSDVIAARAIALADVVLVPCRPSHPDIRAAPRTADEIKAAGRPGWFILNGCPPLGSRHVEARALLAQLLPVCPVVLHQRNAYGDALNDGRSVEEYEKRGKAATEIRQLGRWLDKVTREVTRG